MGGFEAGSRREGVTHMEKAEIPKIRLDNLRRRFGAAVLIAAVFGDHDLTDREKLETINGLRKDSEGK